MRRVRWSTQSWSQKDPSVLLVGQGLEGPWRGAFGSAKVDYRSWLPSSVPYVIFHKLIFM